jgi:hypothetical protein
MRRTLRTRLNIACNILEMDPVASRALPSWYIGWGAIMQKVFPRWT